MVYKDALFAQFWYARWCVTPKQARHETTAVELVKSLQLLESAVVEG